MKNKVQRKKQAKLMAKQSKRKLEHLKVKIDEVAMDTLNEENRDMVNAMRIEVNDKLNSPFKHQGNI